VKRNNRFAENTTEKPEWLAGVAATILSATLCALVFQYLFNIIVCDLFMSTARVNMVASKVLEMLPQ